MLFVFIVDEKDSSDKLTLLYEKYGHLLLRYAHGIVGTPEESQDCVADTFMVLASILNENPGRIGDIESRRTANFLITITKNKALNSLRGKSKLISLDDFDGYADPGDVSVMSSHEIAEARVQLYDEIQKLDERYKSAITLYYLHDCSVSDIAKILDISEGNTKVLLHRARAKLKKALVRYEG